MTKKHNELVNNSTSKQSYTLYNLLYV